MKMVTSGLAMLLGMSATLANAEQTLNVDGTDYPLSALMATCQNITDDPAAQITCFSDISKMLEEQTAAAEQEALSVPEALEALRSVAQYQEGETGLLIEGADCNISVLYYDNYFHISRRNISTIDLFSAQFDASAVLLDQVTQAPLAQVVLDGGATALTHGGVGLDSAQLGFAPRSPRMTVDAYAMDLVGQLAATEGAAFQFVLVHPEQSNASADIWSAFEAFVKACKA